MNRRILGFPYPVLENFIMIYDESWTDCLFHVLNVRLDGNYDKRKVEEWLWAPYQFAHLWLFESIRYCYKIIALIRASFFKMNNISKMIFF